LAMAFLSDDKNSCNEFNIFRYNFKAGNCLILKSKLENYQLKKYGPGFQTITVHWHHSALLTHSI